MVMYELEVLEHPRAFVLDDEGAMQTVVEYQVLADDS